jgi:hypothetical protein
VDIDFPTTRAIMNAYIAGFKACRVLNGKDKPYLSLSQCFKQYGRSNVKSWIEKGLLHPRKEGKRKIEISSIEIEMVHNAVNVW